MIEAYHNASLLSRPFSEFCQIILFLSKTSKEFVKTEQYFFSLRRLFRVCPFRRYLYLLRFTFLSAFLTRLSLYRAYKFYEPFSTELKLSAYTKSSIFGFVMIILNCNTEIDH